MKTIEGKAARQGSAQPGRERLPLPGRDAMTDPQRIAADRLVAGPRKGVYGPFLPLLRSPELLERVANVGEFLRFDSALDARVRELATCAVARHASNQFEWTMHAPLAVRAGVAQATVDALAVGARPRELPRDEEIALDFANELLHTHGVSEPAWQEALDVFGEQGVVELTSLLGYFLMVSWLMNVAHTPGRAGSDATAMTAFPL